MKTAERTKLSASARIAYGAVIAAISPPATLGPATLATELVRYIFELASTKSSRSTSAGRYAW